MGGVSELEPGLVDRYRRVGLLRNPFEGDGGPQSEPGLFVARGLPAEAPSPGTGAFVQVIGESGAGKSTHVQHWRRSTPGPLHYIPRAPYRHRWRRPPVDSIVYGDEIDRMPRRLRRRWFRRLADRRATLVIGTHADLAPLARWAGFGHDGALLSTHYLGPIDRVTLDAILDARIAAAAIGGAELATRPVTEVLTDADRQRIFSSSAGSIRKAETIGHELIAERVR